MIEEITDNEGISCIEAIVNYCEQTGAEIEVYSQLISTHLKARITEEAQALNLIKKTDKLPL